MEAEAGIPVKLAVEVELREQALPELDCERRVPPVVTDP